MDHTQEIYNIVWHVGPCNIYVLWKYSCLLRSSTWTNVLMGMLREIRRISCLVYEKYIWYYKKLKHTLVYYVFGLIYMYILILRLLFNYSMFFKSKFFKGYKQYFSTLKCFFMKHFKRHLLSVSSTKRKTSSAVPKETCMHSCTLFYCYNSFFTSHVHKRPVNLNVCDN